MGGQQMPLEDILAYKDLGIGAVAMFVFYKFATTVTNNAAKQMTELQGQFLVAYKENTKALQELVAEFKEHINIKDNALQVLEKRHDELRNEFEEKYQFLKKFRESSDEDK